MIMPSATCSQVIPEAKSMPSTPTSGASGSSGGIGAVDCAGCGSSIMDRYYLSAVDQHWHVSCLKCSQCKVNLQAEPSCFSRDGLIFCKADYYRLFTMRRCSRCGEGIYASELVMRVRDQNVYHIQCFTCAWCNVTLSQGDLFGIRDNLVYCRTHYEMLCSSSPATFTNSMLSLGALPHLPPGEHVHHHLGHPGHPPPQPHGTHQNSSPLHDAMPGDACSALAATPYPAPGLYSPLSLGGLNSTPNGAPSGQSPTTPQTIRKGRPRKRKNTEQQSESLMSSSACSHESLSPSTRATQSPGNSLDGGGPLSGLAASIENSCNSQLSNSALNLGGHQGGQRTKRMRTSFKHHQLRTMKTYFSVNQNPDAKDLKQLAQKTGLSKRVLQVWFQNARAKWRRNNLKMLPDGPDLSINGQTMLSLGHPSTPSTVIGSPSGSTRPFSSPSPAMSPSGENSSLSHPSLPPSSLSHSQPSGLDHFGPSRNEPSLLPLSFQELY